MQGEVADKKHATTHPFPAGLVFPENSGWPGRPRPFSSSLAVVSVYVFYVWPKTFFSHCDPGKPRDWTPLF